MFRTPTNLEDWCSNAPVFEPLSATHSRVHSFAVLQEPQFRLKKSPSVEPRANQRLAIPWMLRGEMTPKSLAAFQVAAADGRASPIVNDHMLVKTAQGNVFWVICHQVEGHQHRFLVFLSDPQVRTFLNMALMHGDGLNKLGFAWTGIVPTDVADCVVFGSPMGLEDCQQLLEFGNTEHSYQHDRYDNALEELVVCMAVVGHPDFVESLRDTAPVRHVSVSVLTPNNPFRNS
jgi:hypothetical protein